jgi:hypothetical protein
MKPNLVMISALALILSAMPLVAADATAVFTSDFNTALTKEWRLIGGQWKVEAGCLKQTQPRPADPTKAILVPGDRDDLSSEVVVIAKLRLDSWKDGDGARAGVSVCSDPATGHGYNLVLHQGKLEFVHDYVTWGPGVKFPYRAAVWFWVKLGKTAGALHGKAWPDGDPEPADWMVSWQRGEADVTGYPALVGGAAGADDFCTVSFASRQVLQGEDRLRARKAEKALARLNDAAIQSLRLAVEDLRRTYGPR